MNSGFEKCNVIIPARKGSRGFPHKNRKLVPIVLDSVRAHFDTVTVTTDDRSIIKHINEKYSDNTNIRVRTRPDSLALDDTSMRDTLIDVVETYNLKGELVVLYPTYPERDIEDIRGAYNFYHKNNLKSMLCAKKASTHPFLCLLKKEDIFGEQLFEHNLYRRQDYPECFEISHFVVIINSEELEKVNNQLYNNSTGFHRIDNKIDVDYATDLKKYDSTKEGAP